MELGFPGDAVVRNLPANAGDAGEAVLVPGPGRSPGGGNDSPLQCSCLGDPMNRGALWATDPGVTESDTTMHAWTFCGVPAPNGLSV